MLESTSEELSDISILFEQFSGCVMAQAIRNRAWSSRLVPTFAYWSRSSGRRGGGEGRWGGGEAMGGGGDFNSRARSWPTGPRMPYPSFSTARATSSSRFCTGPADGTAWFAFAESLSRAALNNTSNSSSHRRIIAVSTSDTAGGALLVFMSSGSEGSPSRARATFSLLDLSGIVLMSLRFVGGVSIVPALSLPIEACGSGPRKRPVVMLPKLRCGPSVNNWSTAWRRGGHGRKRSLCWCLVTCAFVKKQQHGVGWTVLVVGVAIVEGVFSVLLRLGARRNPFTITEPVWSKHSKPCVLFPRRTTHPVAHVHATVFVLPFLLRWARHLVGSKSLATRRRGVPTHDHLGVPLALQIVGLQVSSCVVLGNADEHLRALIEIIEVILRALDHLSGHLVKGKKLFPVGSDGHPQLRGRLDVLSPPQASSRLFVRRLSATRPTRCWTPLAPVWYGEVPQRTSNTVGHCEHGVGFIGELWHLGRWVLCSEEVFEADSSVLDDSLCPNAHLVLVDSRLKRN